MAPAVSWKSSSCCRNRMACGREVKVSVASGLFIKQRHSARCHSAFPWRPPRIPRDGQTASGDSVEFEVQTEQINPALLHNREAGERSTYVAGEFVDRSVFGHVVLFVRIVLRSDEREVGE